MFEDIVTIVVVVVVVVVVVFVAAAVVAVAVVITNQCYIHVHHYSSFGIVYIEYIQRVLI